MELRSWIKDSTFYPIRKEVYPPRKIKLPRRDQNASIHWFLVDAAYKKLLLFFMKNI